MREPQVRRRQRKHAQGMLPFSTKREQVLAITVRRVLLRAGLTEAVYNLSAGKFTASGFTIEEAWSTLDAPIVMVTHNPMDFTQKAAREAAKALVAAFRPIAGPEAERLIQVERRRDDLEDNNSYLCVLVTVSNDQMLRTLYRQLARK